MNRVGRVSKETPGSESGSGTRWALLRDDQGGYYDDRCGQGGESN